MATALAQPTKITVQLPGRRYDHIFFSASIALMLVTVVVGFGPTYYFAGVFRAPLPSPIIHVHGAIFSLWMLLLVTQTSLVSAHRVDLHRRLGIAGFLVACAMVVIGPIAATDSLLHFTRPGRDALSFYLIPLTDILVFAVVIGFAYRLRRDSAAHKRLVLIATNALLIAAVARWPWELVHRKAIVAGLVSDVFLLALVAYDLWALRRIHRATLWAGTCFVIIQNVRYPISHTAAWHAFAGWVQASLR